MANQTQTKQNGTSGFNPVVAAVAGAVVGAGVAVAGAVVLEDKKTREKIKFAFTNMQKLAEDKKNEAEKKLSGDKEKVKRVIDSAKDSLRQGVKNAKKAAHTK